MRFNLSESRVRGYLRDNAGEVRCGICLARELHLHSSVILPILVGLAERRPPFAIGPCACGSEGLMFLLGNARRR
jgi:hypothetical protein